MRIGVRAWMNDAGREYNLVQGSQRDVVDVVYHG
jgi:hypothetical protein